IKAASVGQECGKFNEEQYNNGNIIVEPNEHPWIGRIVESDGKNRLLCAGVLIDTRHVVTAAHCVKNEYENPIFKVIFGDSDSSDSYLISSIAIHPDYSADKFENDLALIELTKDVNVTDFVQPICLPSAEDPKGELKVAGLEGPSTGRKGPETKRLNKRIKMAFTRTDSQECHKLQARFPVDLICGHSEKGPLSGSALTQASGNPRKFHLIGIAVAGFTSPERGVQGYLNMRPYLDWIRRESGSGL
ncbi:hypothetical protein KR084_009476, partial [Drosophila pseudotakahashii]